MNRGNSVSIVTFSTNRASQYWPFPISSVPILNPGHPWDFLPNGKTFDVPQAFIDPAFPFNYWWTCRGKKNSCFLLSQLIGVNHSLTYSRTNLKLYENTIL